MKNPTKRYRLVAASLLASAVSIGGLAVFGGAASADITTSTLTTPAGTPPVLLGGIGTQAAGDLVITETGAQASSFVALDKYTIDVNPFGLTGSTLTCANGNDIDFSAAPTATVAPIGTVTTGLVLPTVTTTLTEEAGPQGVAACNPAGPLTNEIGIVVNTIGTLPAGDTGWTITLTNVKYNVGPGATPGAVSLADSTYKAATSGTAVHFGTTPSNATVGPLTGDLVVGSDTPAKGLVSGTPTTGTISPITVKETVAGAVPVGSICVALPAGNTFAAAPTATASGGGAVVGTPQISGGFATVPVTTASSTAPATYTISGISVNGQSTPGPVLATVQDGVGCSATLTTTALAFTVISSTRTAGSDADATAIDEFNAAYPDGNPNAIVATDSGYPDALSASYLAGQLKTGILLTPTAALSSETSRALAIAGVSTVYVVGGPLAVSTNTVNTIEAQPVYEAGTNGLTPVSPAATIKVITLAGNTEYDTSALIAQYEPSSAVGTGTFQGAYGKYNDTSGASSVTGPVSGKTAILASGAGFQDATAASVIAYDEQFPVILTTPNVLSSQAQASLTNDAITQVILVGGNLALADGIVGTLEGEGISVLRIAGTDYTDTAQELAQFELNGLSTTGTSPQPEGLNWEAASGNQITLARGDFYTDALAGAAFAAHGGPSNSGNPQPILLTFDANTIGTYLGGFLTKAGSAGGLFGNGGPSQIYTINVVGGTLALTQATLATALIDLAAG